MNSSKRSEHGSDHLPETTVASSPITVKTQPAPLKATPIKQASLPSSTASRSHQAILAPPDTRADTTTATQSTVPTGEQVKSDTAVFESTLPDARTWYRPSLYVGKAHQLNITKTVWNRDTGESPADDIPQASPTKKL